MKKSLIDKAANLPGSLLSPAVSPTDAGVETSLLESWISGDLGVRTSMMVVKADWIATGPSLYCVFR